jgi:hypothetical protein
MTPNEGFQHVFSKANEKEKFLRCRNRSFIIRSSFKTPHFIFKRKLYSGVSGPKESKLGSITDAVNGVSSVNQTVPEVKRKTVCNYYI